MPKLETIRVAAIDEINRQAKDAEDQIDQILEDHHIRAIQLNTEIVDYVNAGRPASPSPTRYVIAAAMATRREITLRDMLEILFDRWRTMQERIATIITELDRLIEAIEAATSIEEIATALASMDWE
jgi:hypothetical protein